MGPGYLKPRMLGEGEVHFTRVALHDSSFKTVHVYFILGQAAQFI